jgi:hypothetical protein
LEKKVQIEIHTTGDKHGRWGRIQTGAHGIIIDVSTLFNDRRYTLSGVDGTELTITIHKAKYERDGTLFITGVMPPLEFGKAFDEARANRGFFVSGLWSTSG